MKPKIGPFPFFKSWRLKGFTLIELLIVVAIISILASLAIPFFTRLVSKSRRTELLVGLGGIYTVEKAYFSSHDVYLKTSQSDCLPGPPYDYYDNNLTIGGFFNLSHETKFYGFCVDIDNTLGAQKFEGYGAGKIDVDAHWDRALVTEGDRVPIFTHDDLTNQP